ncbi:MAG: hypothetical protein PHF19_02320 [Synergistales bacterium]|nr:hypothetical protein [Synergistales bacterium]
MADSQGEGGGQGVSERRLGDGSGQGESRPGQQGRQGLGKAAEAATALQRLLASRWRI